MFSWYLCFWSQILCRNNKMCDRRDDYREQQPLLPVSWSQQQPWSPWGLRDWTWERKQYREFNPTLKWCQNWSLSRWSWEKWGTSSLFLQVISFTEQQQELENWRLSFHLRFLTLLCLLVLYKPETRGRSEPETSSAKTLGWNRLRVTGQETGTEWSSLFHANSHGFPWILFKNLVQHNLGMKETGVNSRMKSNLMWNLVT